MEHEGQYTERSGIKDNLLGSLCYLLFWLTGIIFLITEKNNKFIRFHAMQSVLTFGLFSLLLVIFFAVGNLLFLATNWGLQGLSIFILLLDYFINFSLAMVFILWILLIVKALQGVMFKIPVIGDLAEEKIS